MMKRIAEGATRILLACGATDFSKTDPRTGCGCQSQLQAGSL